MGNETSQTVKYGAQLDNDIKLSWKKSSCDNPFPAREAHCAAAVGNKLYIFGGNIISNDGIPQETNGLLVFDTEKESWSQESGSGSVPQARSAATLAAVGSKLYLFGGSNQEAGWLGGVYVYDTETKTWSQPETSGSSPSGRDKLASGVIGQNIYIFGGFGPQDADDELEEEDEDDDGFEDVAAHQEAAQFGWFDDLYMFDTLSNAWSQPLQMNLGGPTPRAAHAMGVYDKYLIIFGGRDAEARKNDTYIFNTETRKWLVDTKLTGQQAEPRSFHTATIVGNRVVVLGGRGVINQHFSDVNVIDIKTQQWLQPSMSGDQFAGRATHSATVVGDQLVVYGGASDLDPEIGVPMKTYSDIYTIKTAEIMLGKAFTSGGEENQENIGMDVSSGKTLEGSKIVKQVPSSPLKEAN